MDGTLKIETAAQVTPYVDTGAVYSLCIWLQCAVYIHKRKWRDKTI
ncbi:MAG: hypothetical protein J5871_00340 [Bacteroidales bacterium]|nr:hypothetical protein [Bacteroidales bacterium]